MLTVQATTNRSEYVDAALFHSDRFDQVISMGLADERGRAEASWRCPCRLKLDQRISSNRLAAEMERDALGDARKQPAGGSGSRAAAARRSYLGAERFGPDPSVPVVLFAGGDAMNPYSRILCQPARVVLKLLGYEPSRGADRAVLREHREIFLVHQPRVECSIPLQDLLHPRWAQTVGCGSEWPSA